MSHRRINALALLLLALAGAVALWALRHAGPAVGAVTVHATAGSRASVPSAHTPVVIDIPRAEVHARVLDMGLNADGTLQTPGPAQGGSAGWYDQSAAAGDGGTTVIVGQYRIRHRRAVFRHLGLLRPHDVIDVTRRDGSHARFVVTRVVRAFRPTLLTGGAFAPERGAEPRLVACTGGVVVYAVAIA